MSRCLLSVYENRQEEEIVETAPVDSHGSLDAQSPSLVLLKMSPVLKCASGASDDSSRPEASGDTSPALQHLESGSARIPKYGYVWRKKQDKKGDMMDDWGEYLPVGQRGWKDPLSSQQFKSHRSSSSAERGREEKERFYKEDD